MKSIAIYMRVSSVGQDVRSQQASLEAYAATAEAPVLWFSDKFTGTSMDRPEFNKMMAQVRAGAIQSIVIYRTDRLGRCAKGLVELFDELQNLHVNLVSLRDSLDLSTPAGRLMANVLASVASYETEVRKERQLAGIAAALAGGKRWGGRKAGVCWKVTREKASLVRQLSEEKKSVACIARSLGLSRPTVYRVLRQAPPEQQEALR